MHLYNFEIHSPNYQDMIYNLKASLHHGANLAYLVKNRNSAWSNEKPIVLFERHCRATEKSEAIL
jgi:hypothetical protein